MSDRTTTKEVKKKSREVSYQSTVKDLREMCKEKKILLPSGYTNKNKLCELLEIKVPDKKVKNVVSAPIESAPQFISGEPVSQLDMLLYSIIFSHLPPQISTIIDEKTLNERCPLKCKGLNNMSKSKFLGKCNICLEEIDTIKLHRELPCKHVFHPECVDKWLLSNNATCPMCRHVC